ncbi:MAG: sigma-54-dependent Fis family transcriptional regulator [Hyphomicrobiaceae bacterium]|nr:MAG: sigma-54-dependent Fis family transcriptional regulator [Hyphomicrobiaceae bacterium]
MSPEGRTITLVEDDPVMGGSLVQSLSLEGYQVDWCESLTQGARNLEAAAPDLVICDIRLPDGSGQDLFKSVSEKGEAPPFLFMTAFGDIDQAVQLMRAGAGDYLTKPFDTSVFLERVGSIIARRPRREASGALGVSPPMLRIEDLLRRVARVGSTVLFTGETGVGKEVSARFLHDVAAAGKPLVAVNCAAIPRDLLESEIFGHERGAFTGATRRHPGYAERARDGTLFLDEVGELPLELQGKLLRLVEKRQFHRLGAEEAIPFRARLMCATNTELASAVKCGRFREDLFYRINVVSIPIPPLRERHEDIPWLMHRLFVDMASQMEVRARGFSSLAEEACLAHDWPGNVRELRNRVERAMALTLNDWIMPCDLFPDRAGRVEGLARPAETLAEVRNAAERRQIERVLALHGGHHQRAAEALGISRTTLWEKMHRLGIGGASE